MHRETRLYLLRVSWYHTEFFPKTFKLKGYQETSGAKNKPSMKQKVIQDGTARVLNDVNRADQRQTFVFWSDPWSSAPHAHPRTTFNRRELTRLASLTRGATTNTSYCKSQAQVLRESHAKNEQRGKLKVKENNLSRFRGATPTSIAELTWPDYLNT